MAVVFAYSYVSDRHAGPYLDLGRSEEELTMLETLGSRSMRIATAILVALAAATASMVSGASSAAAVGGYTAYAGPYNVRSGPSTSASVIGSQPTGAIPDLICQTVGETVEVNGYASAIWDKVRTPDGVVGYMTDLGVRETKLDGDPRVPRCDPLQPSTPLSDTGDLTDYNRSAAVSWVVSHVQDSQPLPHRPSCTWFVSQALWAGGFAQNPTWNPNDDYGSTKGTRTAWMVTELVPYLRSTYSTSYQDITAAMDGDHTVAGAEAGDLIAYDWEGDDVLDHLTFVVNVQANGYPEVAEWGTIGWSFDRTVDYAKRGWSWSENNHRWMNDLHPEMKVYLLHFNGGFFIPEY